MTIPLIPQDSTTTLHNPVVCQRQSRGKEGLRATERVVNDLTAPKSHARKLLSLRLCSFPCTRTRWGKPAQPAKHHKTPPNASRGKDASMLQRWHPIRLCMWQQAKRYASWVCARRSATFPWHVVARLLGDVFAQKCGMAWHACPSTPLAVSSGESSRAVSELRGRICCVRLSRRMTNQFHVKVFLRHSGAL